MLTRFEAEKLIEHAAKTRAPALAWKALAELDGPSSPDVCASAVKVVLRLQGDQEILRRWGELPPNVRRNVAYAASDFDRSVIEKLFKHPASVVHDRHLLMAGLVRTATAQGIEGWILRLLEQIGEYEDENQQRVLERFKARARAEFKQRSGSGSDVLATIE